MCGCAALVIVTPFQTRRSGGSNRLRILGQDMPRVRYPAKKVQTALRVQVPPGWAQLIRKLRWIGLEQEAKRLEMALSTVPAEQRTAPAGQGHQRS
jgi:hypothetical protein